MPMQQFDSEASAGPADGRYLGNNGRWWVEVRVDTRGTGMVSADLHTDGADHGGFYASVRTLPDASVASSAGRWEAEWVSVQGNEATGHLALLSMPESTSSLTIELYCAEDLDSLPAGTTVTIEGAVWVGEELRTIGVETEVEEGVAELKPVQFKDAQIDFKECLRRAGFAVHDVGQRTSIPTREGGWNSSDIFSELNQVMYSTAQTSLGAPAWELHLMLLSHTKREGLFGLMFDPVDGLSRQGAAVFVDEIRKRVPQDEVDRQIVQTVVHEMGHALNLAHSFGPQVRRSNSTSFMNYDWRYLGGEHAKDYWDKFTYEFDTYELKHLRHAPRAQIIPGGSHFGSAHYWPPTEALTQQVGYWNDLHLWLTPPIAGTTFAFGQPVFLEVSLLNAGCHPVHVPRHILDIKAGQLEVLIRPWTPVQASTGDALANVAPFSPIMHRCFDIRSSGLIELKRGESLHANMNLTYGSGGFSFAEPGAWEVIPILTFPADAESGGLDHVIQGAPLRIRVARPQDNREERDAVETLLGRPDVGMSIALGGADCLQAAADELEEIRARRERETRAGRADPVVAAIARAAGIHEGRRGKVRQAARLLSQATSAEAIVSFDPHTAEHTRRLAARYAAETRGEERAPTVVVDLRTSPRMGLPTEGGRVCGFMIATKPKDSEGADQKGEGWAVLAPAGHLPPEGMTEGAVVEASVVAAADDGLSERLSVSRVDLIGPAGPAQHPALALLWLARSVPADPTPELPNGSDKPVLSRSGDLWEILAQNGARTDTATLRGEPLDQWAAAADDAMADVPGPVPTLNNPKEVFAAHPDDFDDLASWVCFFTPACNPGKPPASLESPYPPSAVTKHPDISYGTKCEPCAKKQTT